MKNSRRFHVAVLVETSRAYGRGLLLGIANYSRDHGPWNIYRQEQKLTDNFPEWLRTWKGDGIITRLENPKAGRFIQRLGVPVVQLQDVPFARRFPAVLTDNAALAAMVFEYFRARGFRHFAFSGFSGAGYSDHRRDAFVRLVKENGLQCHIYKNAWEAGLDRASGSGYYGLDTVATGCFGPKNRERAARWIRELPKPVGLLACNDIRGQQMLEACSLAHVVVPDEVAVMGVNNDDVLCEFSNPPLTSVVPNTRRIGYEAAALLGQMMAGKKAAPQIHRVEPLGIVTRRSTDVLAIEDGPVAAAVRFIHEHACEGIDVNSARRAAALSTRALQRRFLKVLGHTPKEEILRVQINHARQMLLETDLPLKWIADNVGFHKLEYLIRIFKKKTGLTPGQFRARARIPERTGGSPADRAA